MYPPLLSKKTFQNFWEVETSLSSFKDLWIEIINLIFYSEN